MVPTRREVAARRFASLQTAPAAMQVSATKPDGDQVQAPAVIHRVVPEKLHRMQHDRHRA